MLIAEVDDYPAHLHIDLLPELQGQGFGRRLIDTLRGALAERGVAAVHLGMDAANTGRAGVLRPARIPRTAVEPARGAVARHRDELTGTARHPGAGRITRQAGAAVRRVSA